MAVTDQDMDRGFKSVVYQADGVSMRVNDTDMSRFRDQHKTLAKKIGDIKLKLDVMNGNRSMRTYADLDEMCQINISTMKSTINGKINPTRNFLYKFTVGLQMSLEEANELFFLCGGALSEDCKADYICMRALEDKDNIYDFIEDFERYTNAKIGMRNREHSEGK